MQDPPGDDSPQREVSLIMWSDTSSSGVSEHDSLLDENHFSSDNSTNDDNDKPVDTFSYIRPPQNCSQQDPDGDRFSVIGQPLLSPPLQHKQKPPPQPLQPVHEPPSIVSDDTHEEFKEEEKLPDDYSGTSFGHHQPHYFQPNGAPQPNQVVSLSSPNNNVQPNTYSPTFQVAEQPPVPPVQDVCDAIDQVCKNSGYPYSEYACESGVTNHPSPARHEQSSTRSGSSNRTDTQLYSKTGEWLYTIRPHHWNEKLGRVSAQEIALVVGNHQPPPSSGSNRPLELHPTTLHDFLKNAGEYSNYAGMDVKTNLHHKPLDKKVSIRFETTFLPVERQEGGSTEFCAYNNSHTTQDDDTPKNCVVLCTTQGIAVQQDGAGANTPLFLHAVDQTNTVHQYWMEAERSRHTVGSHQVECNQEAKLAAHRGKATASVIGTAAMGTRFNVLMTVQIPLLTSSSGGSSGWNKPLSALSSIVPLRTSWTRTSKNATSRAAPIFEEEDYHVGPVPSHDGQSPSPPRGASTTRSPFQGNNDQYSSREDPFEGRVAHRASVRDGPSVSLPDDYSEFTGVSGPFATLPHYLPEYKFQVMSVIEAELVSNNPHGLSNAARVSRGSEAGRWHPLANPTPKRDTHQGITVTVVLFYTVVGGVPSDEDVLRAIDDMEQLYAACSGSGNLLDRKAAFAKGRLTGGAARKIETKEEEQPYVPPVSTVRGSDVFPS